MRFPIRLSADIFKSRVSGFFAGSSAPPPILRFSNCVTHLSQLPRFDEQSTELEWHSPAECASRARSVGSPVVWIGGAEPLLHPAIGEVAASIVDARHHVFLHTSGYALRQRIHEFRPDSRLFLTLEFAGRETAHDRVMGKPGAFRRSLEAIRTAKLSGFLVAAHFTVNSETDPCEIGELIETLDSRDVDGFIVSTGGMVPSENHHSVMDALSDIRGMIRCGRWETFSRLLEASYEPSAVVPAKEKLSAPGESAFEEGD